MTEHLEKAKNSSLTAIKDGTALHSRYDPRREAQRFVDSLGLSGESRIFLFVEPALGYTVDVLRELFPDRKFLVLHCSSFFKGRGKFDAEWAPDSSLSLEDFLAGEIHEGETGICRLVPWKPALDAYGPVYLDLVSRCAKFLRQGDANRRTAAYFGRRWFRNALTFAALAKGSLGFRRGSAPVAVCGAGPSLEAALPAIRASRAFVLAVSSSDLALREGGVTPDLVLSTDGGFWAKFHLHETVRRPAALAATICAALPPELLERGVLPICGLSSWQRLLLSGSGLTGLAFPERGTVTAAALDLARALSTGCIYLAGMDLGPIDLKLHGRPYILDEVTQAESLRVKPFHTRAFESTVSQEGSFRLYAEWFSVNIRKYSPVRLLGRGHRLLEEALPASETVDGCGLKPQFFFRERTEAPRDGLAILREGLDDPELGPALKEELSGLLGDWRNYDK
jgi:hypothetical protein